MDGSGSWFVRLCWAMLALLASGCGAGSGAAVVVEFWAMGREGEVVQNLMPEFERRNPGIRVRVQQIPWSAAHEKLLTAYAGDSMPDLFQLGNTWIPEFVALRAIAVLDARVVSSRSVMEADYFQGILQTNVMHGLTYGIPWYVDTRLMFYRKDLLDAAGFAEPPRTWAAWLEAMRAVQAHAGKGRYAILLPINEWEVPVILALERGAELLRDGERYGNFRSAAFREAFGFYLSLFRDGIAPPLGTAELGNLYQDFANGYFALYISGPWNIGEFARRLPAALQDAWLTAPMPGAGGAYPGPSIAGGASLAIVRGSKHQDEAWKLIEYLSEPAQQLAFYRLSGDLPARKTAWKDGSLAEDRYARAFWVQLQHVVATPKIPEWERIASAVGRFAEAAIRGAMSADDALSALDRNVDELLEKRRWLLDRARGAGRTAPP